MNRKKLQKLRRKDKAKQAKKPPELHPMEVEVIKFITPMLPKEFWGTEEEALARQLRQLAFAEINVMTIIAFAWQDWLKDNPKYTRDDETNAYMGLISISTGTLKSHRENRFKLDKEQVTRLEVMEPYYKNAYPKAQKYLIPLYKKYEFLDKDAKAENQEEIDNS